MQYRCIASNLSVFFIGGKKFALTGLPVLATICYFRAAISGLPGRISPKSLDLVRPFYPAKPFNLAFGKGYLTLSEYMVRIDDKT